MTEESLGRLLQSSSEFLTGLLRTLFVAEPQGYIALLVMALLWVWGWMGLRQANREIRTESASLRDHEKVVQRLASAGVDAARQPIQDDAEEVELGLVDPWSDLETYADGRRRETHASRILYLVVRHRRLACPNPDAVASAAQDFTLPSLDRQRFTPNALLLVGLAGTVLGLAATVGRIDLGTLTSVEGTGSTISAFEDVLRQLPTAFVATIWGIMSTLTFGSLVARTEARAAAYVYALEREATDVWIPTIWPEALEAQFEDLQNVIQTVQATVIRTGELMRDTNRDLSATMQAATSAMGDHVGQLAAVTGESRGTFERLSGEVTASVTALRTGSDEMRDALERLRGFHVEMKDAYSRLQDLFAVAQTEAKQQVEKTLDLTRNQQTQFVQASSDLALRIDRVVDHFTGLAERLDRQREELTRGMDTIRMSLDTSTRRLWEDSTERLRESTEAMAEATRAVAGPVDNLSELIAESLASPAGRQVLQQLATTVEDLNQNTQWLGPVLASVDAVPEQVDAIVRGFEPIVGQLESIARAVETVSKQLAVTTPVELPASLTEAPRETLLNETRLNDSIPISQLRT